VEEEALQKKRPATRPIWALGKAVLCGLGRIAQHAFFFFFWPDETAGPFCLFWALGGLVSLKYFTIASLYPFRSFAFFFVALYWQLNLLSRKWLELKKNAGNFFFCYFTWTHHQVTLDLSFLQA